MKQNLRLPGPTPLPPEVQHAMDRDMIDHRGPEFSEMLLRCTVLLKKFYRTENDVLIYPGTGTGGLEAAIANSFSPDSAVLAVTVGVFGDRFARIADSFGLDVRRLSLPRGRAVEPEQLRHALDDNSDVVGVMLTHNETSTGVTNPLAELAPIVKERGLLLLVDGVSSVGAMPVETDALDLDIVVSGSQKAWMSPPGLVMLSVSPRAWEAAGNARLPRYYWDFKIAKTALEKGYTHYTPAVSLFYALDVALQLMDDEGMENIWARHHKLADYTRRSVREAGLDLFADERYASDSVTALKTPDDVDASRLRERLRDEFGVTLGDGQAEMAGRVLRIGHMGYVHENDLHETFDALRQALGAEREVRV